MARKRRRSQTRQLNSPGQEGVGPGTDPLLALLGGSPEELEPAEGTSEPEDPEELATLAERAFNHFRPLHRRFTEDMQAARGIWIEQPDSPNDVMADDSIISDTSLRTMANKAIAIMSTADLIFSMRPKEPEHAPLIQHGQAAWRHFESQIERQYTRRMHGTFRYDEAHYLAYRGWTVRRIRLVPDQCLNGEFCFEVQLLDAATIAPVWGEDGLQYLCLKYQAAQSTLLERFPELAEMNLKEITGTQDNPLTPYDLLEYMAVWSGDCVYHYISGKSVRTDHHNYGFVPFVVIPARSVMLPTGMATTAYRTPDGENVYSASPSLPLVDTADMGLSIIHDIIGPTRSLIKLVSGLAWKAEDDVLGRWKKKANGDSAAAIEIPREPGADVALNAAQGEDVEPLAAPSNLDYTNAIIQRLMQIIDQGCLPRALWGLDAGATSALHQAYVAAAATDFLNPYLDALSRARELTWEMAMKLYAKFAPEWAPMTFMAQRGQQDFWVSLGPDDFATLQSADLRARFRNVLPNAQTQNIVNALQLAKAGLVDNLTLLGDEFIGVDDPELVQQRLLSQGADEFPPIKMARSIQAMQSQDPEFFQQFGGLLMRQLQAAEAQASAPPGGPPGQGPPGPPPPQMQPPMPGPPPGGPGIGPGGPTPTQQPVPYGQPGLPAQLLGMGGVPGGLQGLPPTALGGSPYAQGQVQLGPNATDPTVQLIQQLLAQGAGGVPGPVGVG